MRGSPLAKAVRPGRLVRWLHEPHRVYGLWLGKHCVLAAWLGLFLALISPPHGLGLPLCWFHSATGLPCPGCGLTRSLSCGIRGLFLESWQYHPLGLAILALFIFTAAQSVLPTVHRERLGRFIQSRALFFNALYLAFVMAFVCFGAARAIFQWSSVWMHFRL